MPLYIKGLGLQTVYTIMLLYNAYVRSETPAWAKNIVLGVLGYLLAPIDGIPDFTPFIGLTDDLGILSFGLVTIACYINDDIRIKSKEQLRKWFGNFDEKDLASIDEKI